MKGIKGINIKNRTYYFYDDMIDIKYFDSSLLKLDKKLKNIAIYYMGYIAKKDKYQINSVNLLYLIAREIEGSIVEKEGSKYLKNFTFTDSNREVLKNMQKFGVELKIKLKI